MKTIMGPLGELSTRHEVAAPAHGLALWDQATMPLADWGDSPAPVPEFVCDQRLGW